MWPGAQVLGVDPDKERISFAQKNYVNLRSKVHFIVGDDKSFDFKEEEFDLILCNHVIHWVEDKESLMRNFSRFFQEEMKVILNQKV